VRAVAQHDYHHPRVSLVAFSHKSGVRVAEVAFLLFLIAGVWIASASLTKVEKTHTWHGVVLASSRFRMTVAGGLVACGGLLLIIATHWGHLFS
jgi:hypothetical protein